MLAVVPAGGGGEAVGVADRVEVVLVVGGSHEKCFIDRIDMNKLKIEVGDEGDDEEVVSFDLDHNY